MAGGRVSFANLVVMAVTAGVAGVVFITVSGVAVNPFISDATGGVAAAPVSLHIPSSLAPPIPYPESPYTNVDRGAQRMCDAYAAAEARPSAKEWEKAARAANDQHPMGAKMRGEDVMGKTHIWGDAASGVVGRDRVLCVGTNQDPNIDRIALVYEKWARRCDKTLLFVDKKSVGRSVPDEMVVEMHPLGGDDVKNAWQRLRFMVNYLATEWHHASNLGSSVDFILFFGDDTYVFVNNLKAMLREPQYAELDRLGAPLLLGHRMVAGTSDIFVSNAVYVMNPMVLRVLHSLFAAGKCDPTLTDHTDDLPLAQCLLKVGIYALDTYDRLGEDRTTPFNAAQVADVANDPGVNGWYPAYRGRPVGKGRAVMSMYPVAFHYTDLAEMDKIEAAFRGQQP